MLACLKVIFLVWVVSPVAVLSWTVNEGVPRMYTRRSHHGRYIGCKAEIGHIGPCDDGIQHRNMTGDGVFGFGIWAFPIWMFCFGLVVSSGLLIVSNLMPGPPRQPYIMSTSGHRRLTLNILSDIIHTMAVSPMAARSRSTSATFSTVWALMTVRLWR